MAKKFANRTRKAGLPANFMTERLQAQPWLRYVVMHLTGVVALPGDHHDRR